MGVDTTNASDCFFDFDDFEAILIDWKWFERVEQSFESVIEKRLTNFKEIVCCGSHNVVLEGVWERERESVV